MKIDKEKLNQAQDIAKQALEQRCKTRWWLAMKYLERAYGFNTGEDPFRSTDKKGATLDSVDIPPKVTMNTLLKRLMIEILIVLAIMTVLSLMIAGVFHICEIFTSEDISIRL
ncbi:hypothetical protein [Brenneria rubrifaciens]|uniref:Uncharacterized protein n=1 Tax=Brenneria rubrifaciens TaxID=55213 RepID=A0A4P8QQ66_9GAMM|nr:hypothetical protein [Brenneria rubrifaciens]QCR09231.1 hypothetical protein EH207_12275 [Brenneria rubrifaciens]